MEWALEFKNFPRLSKVGSYQKLSGYYIVEKIPTLKQCEVDKMGRKYVRPDKLNSAA